MIKKISDKDRKDWENFLSSDETLQDKDRNLKKNLKIKIIQRTTLDKVLKKNKDKIDILKIDCQSTSLEILKGAKKSLNNKKFNIIFIAINLSEFYKNKKDSFIDITLLLKKFGYEFVNIANAHNGKLGKLDYDFSNFKIWTFDAIFIQKKLL